MSFSIIIPVHNAQHCLGQALESAVRQQVEVDFEVIVVDDGSSDESYNVARIYAEKNEKIRLFRAPVNKGPGRARNIGLKHARGDWIVFLDADDELREDALRQIQGAINECKYQADIIAYDFVCLADNNLLPGRDENEFSYLKGAKKKSQIASLFLRSFVDPSVIIYAYKRDFILAKGILFSDGLHEDIAFSFKTFLYSKSHHILNERIYKKINTKGSVINTISEKHIKGYLNALREIKRELAENNMYQALIDDFRIAIVNGAASRIKRIMSGGIEKIDDEESMFDCIYRLAIDLLEDGGRFLEERQYNELTQYEIIFSNFMESKKKGEKVDEIKAKIYPLFSKKWSCYDIQNSIFLAPDEIRTCCKRYWYDGRLKGDAVLLKINDNDGSSRLYDKIVAEKKRLVFEINRNNEEQCRGCPFLRFDDWKEPLEEGVRYLSIEHHTICNMRCIYCSDVFYGGKKPRYDVKSLIDEMHDASALRNIEYVVWGGGEPILDKEFNDLLLKLSHVAPNVKQRVITNSTFFSSGLASLMAKDKAFIVTSIDAGTHETFKRIRGYRFFDRIIKNVKKYADVSAENVIIKYILMNDNKTAGEINKFSEIVKESNLERCNYQISCDFRCGALSFDYIVSVVRLYSALYVAGVMFQFIDDLIWQRIPVIGSDFLKKISSVLTEDGVNMPLADPTEIQRVAVWGTGAQARLLLKKSYFLRNVKVECFIDPRPNVNNSLDGIPVKPPSWLLDSDLPIVIAAVQSAPLIFRQGLLLGLSKDQFIRSLVI